MEMHRKFICTGDSPIVSTKAGKLRGYSIDGTYVFKGIKYCDARRFMMPEPVKPWDGVKNADTFGYVAPLMRRPAPMGEILGPHRFWPENEDCQYLNVWTQSVSPDAKKPVMVWLHGGGYSDGSSIEQLAYEGENLSKFGDVVVVTLNHRLNILGYLDLSAFGEKYRNSGNAGMADIVAALEWVRDNIAGFGGDPDNVTIFGQSGGGGKVQTLLQMPCADGLFHRAIIQSGAAGLGMDGTGKDMAPAVLALLQQLGLTREEVGKLETLPYSQLCDAWNTIAPEFMKQGKNIGWAPTVNDYYLGNPLRVGFRAHALTIPTMIGTVFGEFAFGVHIERKNQLPESERETLVRKRFGEHADSLLPLFRAAYPEKNIADLLYLDDMFRGPSLDVLTARAAAGGEPVYSYMFAYEFPYMDGTPAWHCAEIPFVFHNAAMVEVCNDPGVSEKLEAEVSSAWVSFARSGDPNNAKTPNWPDFGDRRATMVFAAESGARYDYDTALLQALQKVPRPPMFF
jgi:para-nitrobenzyl esterase